MSGTSRVRRTGMALRGQLSRRGRRVWTASVYDTGSGRWRGGGRDMKLRSSQHEDACPELNAWQSYPSPRGHSSFLYHTGHVGILLLRILILIHVEHLDFLPVSHDDAAHPSTRSAIQGDTHVLVFFRVRNLFQVSAPRKGHRCTRLDRDELCGQWEQKFGSLTFSRAMLANSARLRGGWTCRQSDISVYATVARCRSPS